MQTSVSNAAAHLVSSDGLEVQTTVLPGVVLLRPRLFKDARGTFSETYNARTFAAVGIHDEFVQDNHSRSTKGTVRGLHYQLQFSQAKVCRVVSGAVFDVAVDIRRGSPTFGKWTGVVLSDENRFQIYVPRGFAHGFVVLSDSADFLYKCSDYYSPRDERGIAWNDPDINIAWDVQNPLLSDKDRAYPFLRDVPPENLPGYSQ